MVGPVVRGCDDHGPAQDLVVSAVAQSPLPDAIALCGHYGRITDGRAPAQSLGVRFPRSRPRLRPRSLLEQRLYKDRHGPNAYAVKRHH